MKFVCGLCRATLIPLEYREENIIWSHLEDTNCDDPVPVEVNIIILQEGWSLRAKEVDHKIWKGFRDLTVMFSKFWMDQHDGGKLYPEPIDFKEFYFPELCWEEEMGNENVGAGVYVVMKHAFYDARAQIIGVWADQSEIPDIYKNNKTDYEIEEMEIQGT